MRQLLVWIFAVALACWSTCPASAAEAPAKKLTGSIDQWSIVCNAAGIKLNGSQIEKVMLGTPAFYSGLRPGDKIVTCDVADKTMKITFERAGKRYGVNLPTHAAAMVTDGVGAKRTVAGSLSEAQALARLKECDVILFIDRSGSMGDPIKSEGISKWKWVDRQIQQFIAKYQSVAGRPVTLVTFNHSYDIHKNCTMRDVQEVFTKQEPHGGTHLAPPLAEVLAGRLKEHARPLVIAILHDGLAGDEAEVEALLTGSASLLRNSDQLHISFLQIGDEEAGADAIKRWEKADFGGKHIDSHLFDELKRSGLAPAMAAAVVVPQTAATRAGASK